MSHDMIKKTIIACAAAALLLGVNSVSATQEARCSKGLNVAEQELSDARVKGFGGSVAFVKAAGLLTGAAVQKQFGKYRNCIIKVDRARKLIKKARQGKPS